MPGITIKKIAEDLYRRLVETARTPHRSLAKEIVVALERHVGKPTQDKQALLERIRAVRGRYQPTISDADIEGWKNVGPAMIVVDSNLLAYLLLPTPLTLPKPMPFSSRIRDGIALAGSANFAWVQYIVHHLAPAGVAGFVLANGSMSSNQSGEGEILKNLIEANLVDCMVAAVQQPRFTSEAVA